MNPTVEPPAPMSEAQRALVAEEDTARQLFAEQPQHTRLQDAHLLLHRVFDPVESARYVYAKEDADEARVPKLLTYARDLTRTGAAIVARDTFDARLREFTQGIFEGLNWTHIFMAGGAVVGALQNPADEGGYKGSDIDLFVHGVASEAEASAVLKHVYDTVLSNTRARGGRGDVVRSHRALTILCAYPYRHVQVVLRLYKSPAEVLLGFDIDSCCVGYDGQDVWAMERFRRALTKRYNLVNVSRRSLTYEQRLAKYAKRGFAVAVPNLDKSRVNAALFTRRPAELSGLSKLLLYDYLHHAAAQGVGMNKARARAAQADEEGGSDYNGDVNLPWGPQWQNEAIINLVHAQHKARFFSQLRRKGTGASGTAPQGAASKGFEHVLTADASELKASDFTAWQRSLDKKKVSEPLTWIKDSPAYQDYDNGFRRLMTGSFEPVVDANWEREAYAAADAQRADPRLLSRNDDSAATAPQPRLGFAPAAVGTAPATKAVTKAPSNPFGANNAGLKKMKKMVAVKKRKADSEEDFSDDDDGSGDEDGSDEDDEDDDERPKKALKKPAKEKPAKKATAKMATAKVTFAPMTMTSPAKASPPKPTSSPSTFFAPTASPAPSFGNVAPSLTGGGFASSAATPAAFGGATGGLSVFAAVPTPAPSHGGWGTASPVPDAGGWGTASPAPAGGGWGQAASAAAPSLSAFGGPSVAAPSTPARVSAPNAYTMTDFGGYGGAAIPFTAPDTRNVIDTPSKGLAAFGPQPGASFGFTTPATLSASANVSSSSAAPSLTSYGFGSSPVPPYSTPASVSPSITSSSSGAPFTSLTSRALLLVALFAKQNKLSAAEKAVLKDRVLRNDVLIVAALEVFDVDQDLDELSDTLRRIAQL